MPLAVLTANTNALGVDTWNSRQKIVKLPTGKRLQTVSRTIVCKRCKQIRVKHPGFWRKIAALFQKTGEDI